MRARRIGLVGLGYIGAHVYRRLNELPDTDIEIAFVYNRSADRRAGMPPALVLEDLSRFEEYEADLIVEMAHPAITREFGAAFLRRADYLITSVSAMADRALHLRLEAAALNNRRRLFVPHGALVGADCLFEQRDSWNSVTITFRKHPDNIDFSESGYDPSKIDGETVVFDGPAREIAGLYPRNVNTMVTCGLASVGLDKCRAILVADPSLDRAIAEVEAIGKDGSIVRTHKEQPAVGVSGTDMLESIVHSVRRAASYPPGLAYV